MHARYVIIRALRLTNSVNLLGQQAMVTISKRIPCTAYTDFRLVLRLSDKYDWQQFLLDTSTG